MEIININQLPILLNSQSYHFVDDTHLVNISNNPKKSPKAT